MNATVPTRPSAPAGPPPIPFNGRLACGLLGILIGAMVAGLNNRVPGLTLADIRGAQGWDADASSWLSTVYSAGELVAMPFASWFAITFSLRRFHMWMTAWVVILALVIPFVHSLPLLLVLRALQGVFSGTLIPLLMMAALRFLPTPIRLHGLALYAMTATFAPNVAVWLAAFCVDRLADWRWVYWSIIPLGLAAMALVFWGIPKMPLALPRARQANWLGMALGVCGLSLLVVAMDQGVRLEWLHSSVIRASLLGGVTLTALFLVSEWIHPAPFMKLQLLQRRNLGLGFTIFFCLLVTMSTGVALPTNTLAHLQTFRMAQLAPLGLAIGLPQLVLGPAVALLLYQRWVDARYLFSLGLVCIAVACWMAADITSEWMVSELVVAQVLQAMGQPMAVISLLFLATSVVQPMEGPSVAGTVNTLRALGTIFSGALVGQILTVRSTFHGDMLLDNAGEWLSTHAADTSAFSGLSSWVGEQASVLATADIYRLFAVIAVLLIPLVLSLKHIPAPLTQPVTPAPQPGAAH